MALKHVFKEFTNYCTASDFTGLTLDGQEPNETETRCNKPKKLSIKDANAWAKLISIS